MRAWRHDDKNNWVKSGIPTRDTCALTAYPHRLIDDHIATCPSPISAFGTSNTMAMTLRRARRLQRFTYAALKRRLR
jgi:hypothetical protein